MKTNINHLLITEHVWRNTYDNWGEYCIYCNSRVGINTGTDGIVNCNPRFDEDNFKRYIEFRNFSRIIETKKSRTIKYIKRFSDDEIKTKNQLLTEYLISNGISTKFLKEVKQKRKEIKNKK